MDEATWLTRTDPGPMLASLRGRASDRKLRLFAWACVRRVWGLLLDRQAREAAERAEALADGELRAGQVGTSWSGSLVGEGAADAAVGAAWAAHAAGYPDAATAAGEAASAAARAGGRGESPAHCLLLR